LTKLVCAFFSFKKVINNELLGTFLKQEEVRNNDDKLASYFIIIPKGIV